MQLPVGFLSNNVNFKMAEKKNKNNYEFNNILYL